MITGATIAAALVLFATAAALGWRWSRLWLFTTTAGAAAFVLAALRVLLGGAAFEWEWRGLCLGGQELHLRLDGVSALFLALVGLVGGVGAVYARQYWPDAAHAESAPRGRFWWAALLASMGLVLLCANGLHFLIVWEAFALCAYFLISLDRARAEVRKAGWLYLAASHAGTLALFAFFSLLAVRTGGWDLGPLQGRNEVAPLFWLALLGFGVKAGLFPLHIWLPPAHANAPSHVSALMSGVAIKMGIYGIVRFSGWLPLPAGAGWMVITLGAASALLGVVFAFAQNDLKRLLAYCSVENIGVILIGLGVAMLGVAHGDAPWGRLALAGALLHVWNHGLFKSLLFLGAGSVLHATGTREMSHLGGLWRAMPWTASLFALGSVAISALPPLNGFISEWLIYLGLFEAAASHHSVALATVPATILLGVTGALALATFIKAAAVVFLGAPRTRHARHAHECGWLMRAPMLVLAGGCIVVALAPTLFWGLLSRASAAWVATAVPDQAPLSLPVLGRAQVLLALAMTALGAWFWSRVTRRGLRRGPTWDCGYAAPTARMQYSGASFAGIVGDWFRLVLRTERRRRRPRGPFPPEASHAEHVPDLVLDGALVPVNAFVLNASAFVRRLQHGRLPDYILYLVAGLAVISAIVVFGGKP